MFDYKLSKMEFSLGDFFVILQGDRSLVKSQMSLKSMRKTFEKEDQEALIELSTAEQWKVKESKDILADCLSLKPEVQRVFLSFSSVFEPNNQLPPPRDYDHTIKLEPRTRAVNVRPYRYPQF